MSLLKRGNKLLLSNGGCCSCCECCDGKFVYEDAELFNGYVTIAKLIRNIDPSTYYEERFSPIFGSHNTDIQHIVYRRHAMVWTYLFAPGEYDPSIPFIPFGHLVCTSRDDINLSDLSADAAYEALSKYGIPFWIGLFYQAYDSIIITDTTDYSPFFDLSDIQTQINRADAAVDLKWNSLSVGQKIHRDCFNGLEEPFSPNALFVVDGAPFLLNYEYSNYTTSLLPLPSSEPFTITLGYNIGGIIRSFFINSSNDKCAGGSVVEIAQTIPQQENGSCPGYLGCSLPVAGIGLEEFYKDTASLSFIPYISCNPPECNQPCSSSSNSIDCEEIINHVLECGCNNNVIINGANSDSFFNRNRGYNHVLINEQNPQIESSCEYVLPGDNGAVVAGVLGGNPLSFSAGTIRVENGYYLNKVDVIFNWPCFVNTQNTPPACDFYQVVEIIFKTGWRDMVAPCRIFCWVDAATSWTERVSNYWDDRLDCYTEGWRTACANRTNAYRIRFFSINCFNGIITDVSDQIVDNAAVLNYNNTLSAEIVSPCGGAEYPDYTSCPGGCDQPILPPWFPDPTITII